MTIYQVAFYLGVPVPEMGKVRMSLDEAVQWFGPQVLRGMG